MSVRAALATGLGRRAARRRSATVVMVHWGRCGSTVVGDLLDQHPDVGWDGELLQPALRARDAGDGRVDSLDGVDPVALFLRRSRRHAEPVHGIEVKPFHLALAGSDPVDFVDRLGRLTDRVVVVVLRRRNVLRKVVSSLIAWERDEWHRRAGTQPVAARVHVDTEAVFVQRRPQRLVDLLDEIAAEHERVLAAFAGRPDTVVLTYEDDVAADPTSAAAAIVDVLGLAWHAPTVAYAPTTPFPLSEVVSNLGDVREALAGTPHEWMLDDA